MKYILLLIFLAGCAESYNPCDTVIENVEASGCPSGAVVKCLDGWLVLDCGGWEYRPGASCVVGDDGYPMVTFDRCEAGE
jgi:hypothetical protein